MNLRNDIEKIDSRQALSKFLEDLSARLERGEIKWENRDMAQYIEAMSAWIADMDGYYRNVRHEPCPDKPSWRTLAEIILASSQYE